MKPSKTIKLAPLSKSQKEHTMPKTNPAVTDEQILEQIEEHADNGVPPFSLPLLISETLGVPQKRVKALVAKWWNK
jgi:hypothetical protein